MKNFGEGQRKQRGHGNEKTEIELDRAYSEERKWGD
jgi:hypothetical protein